MYDNLFTSVRLGDVEVRNRIARSAHLTGLPWIDRSDDLLAYHEERARGGIGLSILEIGGVHPTSPSQIPMYRDDVRSGLARLVEMSHRHGMVLFQQLWHAGSSAPRTLGGRPRWSASDVPNPVYGLVPIAMTQAMIDELVESFAAAAVRAQDAGMDGVELHAAHGYLFNQFLSPLTNNREDGYGGSVANRARFLREVVAAIRGATAPGFPIAVKLSAEDDTEGGTTVEETAEVVASLGRSVQLVDVSTGSYYDSTRVSGSLDLPLGYELPASRIVTAAAEADTMVNGRIMTLEQASTIIGEGAATLVSMVRATIADPMLVTKTITGRIQQVRPCTSSNQGCVAGLTKRGIRCVNNPSAGTELTIPEQVPATRSARRVVVVGGGPAGLEAARTARLAGHDVTLYELTGALGGQYRIAGTAPHRSDLLAAVEWYSDELRRLGVRIRLGTPVDHTDVLAGSPDVVVVATGSSPRTDGFQIARPNQAIPGARQAHVYTSWDVFGFGGRARIGDRTVLFDDIAHHEGIAVAEQLVAAGTELTIVTRLGSLGARVTSPEATAELARRRLREAGIQIITDAIPIEIGHDRVRVNYLHTSVHLDVPADTVVLVGRNRPNRELYDLLPADGPLRLLVGEASAINGWEGATRTGHAAGLMIGAAAAVG